METINKLNQYIYNQDNKYVQSLLTEFSFAKLLNDFVDNAVIIDSDDFSSCITFFTDLITCRWLTTKKQHKKYLKTINNENIIGRLFQKYNDFSINKKHNFITFLGRGGFKTNIKVMKQKLYEESGINPIICHTWISEICWLNKKNIIKLTKTFIMHKNYLFRLMIIDVLENEFNCLTKKQKNKLVLIIMTLEDDDNDYIRNEANKLLKLYKENIEFVPIFNNLSKAFLKDNFSIDSFEHFSEIYLEEKT